MGVFKPHFSTLSAAQQRLWPELKPAPELGFVLYGGTAIALRLEHRASVDFAFFTDKPLDKTELRAAFGFLNKAQLLQDQPDTFTANILHETPGEQAVKISFFGDIDFGRFSDPDITDDGILQVASPNDLMATKLKVMLQRIEAKDYKDIAAMLKAGCNLDRGLAIACVMFGNNFQPSESLKALVWFEGGDLHLLTSEEKQRLIEAAGAVHRLPEVVKVAQTLAAS